MEYDPPHTNFAKEIICDATFRNPVQKATYWYTLTNKDNGFAIIRLK